MSGLKSLARRPNGGFGNHTPSESVPFVVDKYFISDPKRMKANNAEDYVEGFLLRDALGLTAEFDEESNTPITKVQVYLLPPDADRKSTFARPEILDKRKGGGMAKAVKEGGMNGGGILRADGCVLKADKGKNVLAARWLNTMTASYDPNVQYPVTGRMVQLMPEVFARPEEPEARNYQNSIIIESDLAQTFSGVEDFKAKAIALMSSIMKEQTLPGSVGFKVRMIDPEEMFAVSEDAFSGWMQDLERVMTAEEVVDRFFAREKGDEWVANMEAGGAYICEVMPVAKLATGTLSLPSARYYNKVKEAGTREQIRDSGFDLGVSLCGFPKPNEEDPSRIDRAYGVIRADLFAERKALEDKPGEYSRWFRTDAAATSNERKIYGPNEFVTPNLPENVIEEFEKRAKANYKAAADERKAKKEAAAAPAEEEQHSMAGPR